MKYDIGGKAAESVTAPAGGVSYKDSTPEMHVGNSTFEGWYSTYNPAHKSDKQRARDAYSAGMGDPLVIAPTPPTQAQVGAVPLTDGRILELAGLAPDRMVCASTCMAAKFDKKPCECYPTSASRSEVVAIARAIEAAHGIKGGQHD